MSTSAITEKSPMRILETSLNTGMGPGSLGVIMARAGVGKTACLVHIAIDRILLGEQVAHVSIGEGPDKVKAWYNETTRNLVQHYAESELEDGKKESSGRGSLLVLVKKSIEENSVILNYAPSSFSIKRLKESLKMLREQLAFDPKLLVVDDVDFEKAERRFFQEAKDFAAENGVEMWFTAKCSYDQKKINERGIPYPCDTIDDLFDVIVMLIPKPPIIALQILKGDGLSGESNLIHLEPKTMLLEKQR